MLISTGQRGKLEAKPTRAASIIPIYVRLPLWVSRLDTDAINRRVVQGLLRSGRIGRHLSDIPCDIIHTLENDAEEAKTFISELEEGKVPTIIQHLPDEVIGIFKDVVGIFATLPTQIAGVAEAAVTDAVKVFNDIGTGAIVSDLEGLPGVIVSDVTNAWGDLTSGLVDDWNALKDGIGKIPCIFGNCPAAATTTVDPDRSCGRTQAITAQTSFQSSLPSRSSSIHPTSPALSTIPSPTQTRPKSSSSPVQSSQLSLSTSGSSPSPSINVADGFKIDRTILRLNIFQLCLFLGLGSLGFVFFLL